MPQTDQSASRALRAAGDGPPFTAALNAAALALTGPDARAFLHGQLANDVNGLPVGGSGRSLLLNHKGHALAETAVLRTPAGLLCLVDDDKVAWTQATLEQHIVFDDVRLHRPAAGVVTLQGAQSAAVLTAAGLPVPAAGSHAVAGDGHGQAADGATDPSGMRGRLAPGVDLLVYPSRRSAAGGFDLCLVARPEAAGTAAAGAAPTMDAAAGAGAAGPEAAGDAPPEPTGAIDSAMAALLARLAEAGAVAAGPSGLAAARVAGAVPTAGAEGGEGVLPQEAGLSHLISYRKGCYLGQEIMARIEARGNLRRELATLELEGLPAGAVPAGGGPVAPRLAIELAGKTVGLLGTVARLPGVGVRALAVLRRDVPVEARLSVAGVAGRRLMLGAPIMPA